MSILVTAATDAELLPFRVRFPEAEILITGVGIHATLFELTLALQKKKYHQVIQVGIAGAYDERKTGQAFLVSKDRFADVGVWEKGGWASIFELGFADQQQPPFTEGWIVNTHPMLVDAGIVGLNAISVNTLTDRNDWNQLMQQQFGAQLESMEGAAFHFVCKKMNVPFLQIRGVSNRVGERDKSNWKISEAIQASCELLADVYQQLKKDE